MRLTRKKDGKVLIGEEAKWVEWDDNGKFKEFHDEPSVGRSCILDPKRGPYFTWMTTCVTGFNISEGGDVTFTTKNSEYILEKISEMDLKKK
jgi:hypothetical protein